MSSPAPMSSPPLAATPPDSLFDSLPSPPAPGIAAWDLEAFDAAIVDLDGTMVDTLGDFEVALGAMLGDLGLAAVDRAFIGRTVGRGGEHLVARTLAHVGASPELQATAWARYQHHYARVNGRHAAVYDGVREGLVGLRTRGWRLACVTNKPAVPARALLSQLGLASCFDHVFGGDSFERRKPDPLPLLRTCEALGTLPSRTLMIGDSRNDAEAARGAGCPVVLVSYGYNHGEPVESAGADAVLPRIDALLALARSVP